VTYFVCVFSPETATAFGHSNREVVGFRRAYQRAVKRIQPRDVLACYVTRVSRWCGLLEVVAGPFISSSALFVNKEVDPFELRFAVRPVVWLSLDEALPIRAAGIWNALSFTNRLEPGKRGWTAIVRGQPKRLLDSDGTFLARALTEQSSRRTKFPLEDAGRP